MLSIATEEDEDEDAPVRQNELRYPSFGLNPALCRRSNCKSATHSCCRKAGRSACRSGLCARRALARAELSKTAVRSQDFAVNKKGISASTSGAGSNKDLKVLPSPALHVCTTMADRWRMHSQAVTSNAMWIDVRSFDELELKEVREGTANG